MDWITVILFILIGLGLIVVEIIFIPGTTLVGILGFCLVLVGVIMSFSFFGRQTGWVVLGVSAVASGGMLLWALRAKPWMHFSLKDAISSKVNEGLLENLQVGQEGMAVSSLRPGGKADFNGKLYEVTTVGDFVESKAKIKIIKISSHQIIVQPV